MRLLALTVGDINGIGPEIVLKGIQRMPGNVFLPLLVGPLSVFEGYARLLRLPMRFQRIDLPRILDWQRAYLSSPHWEIPVVDHWRKVPPVCPGVLSRAAGRIAFQAIETAVRILQMGVAEAMVTAPVSKRAWHKAGVEFSGQTEMLQHLTGAPRAGMMLLSPIMRVGLVTIHTPISAVAGTLSRPLVLERFRLFHHALITDWRIQRPRLAVLGLNPHAGEGGDIGDEELTILAPAIRKLQQEGLEIEGPFPADGFFARYRPGRQDAVIAIYHDQGLVPLKMTAGGRAVNVTVGLPIVRTSPGHGTAFDLAGKLTADPRGMIEAIKVAVQIVNNRQASQDNQTLRGGKRKKTARNRR